MPMLPPLDVPPYRLTGTVYGALLNHRPQLAALGDAVHTAPYKAAPQAPVLTVMPRHMLSADGSPLPVPAEADGLDIGPALGLVIGRTASRVMEGQAMTFIAGFVLLGEVTLPLASHYRPAVRLRCRDGHCPVGTPVPARALPDPNGLSARVWVDGTLAQHTTTGDRLRSVARLLADVTAFMTLQPGDVLSLGRAHGAPRVRAGQQVQLEIDGLPPLHHRVVAEEVAA